jgi:diguanylate cyclase (GGDEF)-like protein
MNDVRLLILDDDPLIGKTIQMIVDSSGARSRFTTDPDEFFELVTQWSPTHLAIDLNMPEMDGVQVLAELARRGTTCRIIITSGVGNRVLEAAGRSAAEHGLNIAGVLPKPFVPAALRRLLVESDDGKSDAPTALPKATADRPAAPRPFTIDRESLQEALEQHRFALVYQPKIRCVDGSLAGFEALVRWHDPVEGAINPDRFIPKAETFGLIDALTEQVFDQSLTWLAELIERSSSDGRRAAEAARTITLSINLSARSLKNTELIESISQRCATAGIHPERIIFELTETSTMENPVEALDLLTRLRMKGFQLSIDDFGTGFSSMLQLVRLPFSEIKVDRSFVMTARHSDESRTVIRSIVDLGRSLGLKSTAEGVEDHETLIYLRDIGCDLAQGFGIARPMEGERVLDWIRERYPGDEEAWRLATLKSMRLLDSPAEDRYDRITRLARRLFGMPMSLISLIDADRQWFKSSQGLGVSETPRDIAFCAVAVACHEMLVVEDASSDPRFHANPLVTGEPHIRFYAGAPVSAPNGSTLGTLCIIDTAPHAFDARAQRLLAELARLVEVEFSLDASATIDRLTSLSNRQGFEARAAGLLDLFRLLHRPVSLLFFDLHGLRRINERAGALAGDRVLLAFTSLLKRTFRESDLLARFGGDEFVALMCDTDARSARRARDRMLAGLVGLGAGVPHAHLLTCDIGETTLLPDDGVSLQALLARADARSARLPERHADEDPDHYG